MVKGDIVLITFPFTDLSGSKLRPTVVLSKTALDVTVCFITTQMQWQEPTDAAFTRPRWRGICFVPFKDQADWTLGKR